MSDEIKVNDLVRVAYPMPCCGARDGINRVYYVGLLVDDGERRCKYCKTKVKKLIVAVEIGAYGGFDVRRLKRIDPPAVNDEVETQRDVTA